jgi:hypothetical protein
MSITRFHDRDLTEHASSASICAAPASGRSTSRDADRERRVQRQPSFTQTPRCGHDGMLPGRVVLDGDGQPICRSCAGVSRDFTCRRCGTEGDLYRRGSCTRCALRDDPTVDEWLASGPTTRSGSGTSSPGRRKPASTHRCASPTNRACVSAQSLRNSAWYGCQPVVIPRRATWSSPRGSRRKRLPLHTTNEVGDQTLS